MAAEKLEIKKDNSNELFLIDGSGFIFRAYFALPQNLTNPAGQPVGAVLGFCNMLYKLLDDLRAQNIAVIFDAAKNNFRNEIYEDYKAHRPDAPEDLIPQFPLFRKAAEAFGLPAIEMEGYEADDLIATYSKLAQEKGMTVTIVGSDKDLMQLINDKIKLYDPIKQAIINADAVEKKFGVQPEKMIDLQALTGDSVDNIPGVPSIGPKTAAQLLDQFGTLENLLENLDEIPQPKRREVLKENVENARMSKKLVTLAQNVDVPVSLDDMAVHDPKTPDLKAFLEEQGFKTLISRIGYDSQSKQGTSDSNSNNVSQGNDNNPPISQNQYQLINTEKDLEDFIQAVHETGHLVFDTETTHLTPRHAELVGIALSCEIGKAYYLPLSHKEEEQDLLGSSNDQDLKQVSLDIAIKHLKPIMEDPAILKIAHNAKYDVQIFKDVGMNVTPLDDTMLISYVLDGSSHRHNMDALSEQNFGHKPIKFEEVAGKGKKQVTFDYVPLT